MSDVFHVAIDGPVASGKGSVARELSKVLGIAYLDTGAMYRGVAVFVRDRGIENLARMKMDVSITKDETKIFLNENDVTNDLRANDISALASEIANDLSVRAQIIDKIRQIAKTQSFVVEGRDICHIVLPDARFKFYLTADLETRARRRFAELIKRGQKISFEEVINQTGNRDKNDAHKPGVTKAGDKGVIVVDNTKLGIDEAVGKMYNIIRGINDEHLSNRN